MGFVFDGFNFFIPRHSFFWLPDLPKTQNQVGDSAKGKWGGGQVGTRGVGMDGFVTSKFGFFFCFWLWPFCFFFYWYYFLKFGVVFS